MALDLIEAPSPNFDARRAPPDAIVLHYTGMQTGDAALERLVDRGGARREPALEDGEGEADGAPATAADGVRAVHPCEHGGERDIVDGCEFGQEQPLLEDEAEDFATQSRAAGFLERGDLGGGAAIRR